MRDSKYYISASMKSLPGWIEYARFYIGDKMGIAHSVFEALEGNKDQTRILRMDLMEKEDPADILLDNRYCTSPDFAENCKIITHELFKVCNLEERL